MVGGGIVAATGRGRGVGAGTARLGVGRRGGAVGVLRMRRGGSVRRGGTAGPMSSSPSCGGTTARSRPAAIAVRRPAAIVVSMAFPFSSLLGVLLAQKPVEFRFGVKIIRDFDLIMGMGVDGWVYGNPRGGVTMLRHHGINRRGEGVGNSIWSGNGSRNLRL